MVSNSVKDSSQSHSRSPEGRSVYVIDDDKDVRQSLHFSLGSIGIVGWPFSSGQDFLDHVDTLKPAPILLDMRMPGINGLDLLARLRENDIAWPVIMMSAHGDIRAAVQSMRLGAVDFLEKPFSFEDLEKLLEKAYDGLAEAVELVVSRKEAEAAFAELSQREREVFDLLVTGMGNKEVARELGISARTVEIHRANGMAKLGLKSLAQVVALKFLADGARPLERSHG